jgi:hypothetical protein
LGERTALDELTDRVAAILEATGFPVDHGELRLTGDHALQAWGEAAISRLGHSPSLRRRP